jgi:ATP-dependent RNA helicase SUPV3L1/SUV3
LSKKRLNKLNHKVKKIFNGLGFDEGIKYLSLDTLIELSMVIGIKDVELNQKSLLREIRHIWSNKELSVRVEIVNYLEMIDFSFNNHGSNDEQNRKDKLNTLLLDIEMTPDERVSLIALLDGVKTKDIDSYEINNRLKQVRDNIKLEELFKEYRVDIEYKSIYISKDYSYSIKDENLHYYIVLHFIKDEILMSISEGSGFDIESEFEKENHKAIREFEAHCKRVAEQIYKEFREYEISQSHIKELVDERAIYDISENHLLELSTKATKRIRKRLNKDVAELKAQKQRVELLARSVRDFKNLFPMARELDRELVFYTGPTNSGKTYRAFEELKEADTGFYLAPLRLLALEGYETLMSEGIDASLITGEEQIVNDDAWHISSTIEMLNFNLDVDVCVIDEVQMINDRDRGWAWTNAIIGVAAKRVIMTGSIDALDAIRTLAQWLGEKLTIVEHERKNTLELLPHPINMDHIPPKSAIVAFSRKDVLAIKQQLSHKYNVSVVYGNLSPEVRREEANRFRTGQTEVLVSTDAIAMGLNLPIKTVIFAKDSKFDGESRRKLTSSEIQQIAGRAGRYGHHEKGYVGALNHKVLSTLEDRFHRPLGQIHPPFAVMANLDHIELISRILNTKKLAYILDFFGTNMEFDGPFRANNIESMLELAKIVDNFDLSLRDKFTLSCAPMTLVSPYLHRVYLGYASLLEKNMPIEYRAVKSLPMYATSTDELLRVEDMVKEITLYLWLSFKFENFVDVEKVKVARDELNKFIENSLKHSQFVRRCSSCGQHISARARHDICDRCFRKLVKRKR